MENSYTSPAATRERSEDGDTFTATTYSRTVEGSEGGLTVERELGGSATVEGGGGGGGGNSSASVEGEASESSSVAARRSTAYSMTREKLLLTYRYMKGRLNEQPHPPTIIYIPPGVIYRRFGFGIALGKLIKVYVTMY